MAKLPWKSWHEVVQLRNDLKSGQLPMHMFAADLYEVMMQRGKQPIYESPDEFFALTYPTYNIRELARDVVNRLAGKNDKAVRQLALTYGGGKTHTLITLYHLVRDPQSLPDLPAIHEFNEHIGTKPPKTRVVTLCFDKLDVEKGAEIRGPDGSIKRLKHPWSVLAYQLAGDEGLRILHAEEKVEERETAPAENTLSELLEFPGGNPVPTLLLIDEVLMYAREKVGQDREWRSRLVNFFQYLTQAATKTKGCCVVASLLASDVKKNDNLGIAIQNELYDIFQREREENIQPVLREDIAEILRRRLFEAESVRDPGKFKPHVVAALKGVFALDEQTQKEGARAEERFLRSYPFHPDLTEIFYEKWTQLKGFQRTRGVLRIFALALRAASEWDQSPLVGANVFLASEDNDELSEATRELVQIADQQSEQGTRHDWASILSGELRRARELQQECVGVNNRELERATLATFLHSQPIGRTARTSDVLVLVGQTRPDKIELGKALMRWAETSHWLDDRYTNVGSEKLPGEWRLGNRPNLVQMHAEASRQVSDDIVEARLIDEISRQRQLSASASALGVKVHTLPDHPNDVKDDGNFHYAILNPSAVSDSGKPSLEARRFLDETTSSEKPRVYRNAVVLVAPSKDGIEVARKRVRDYLGWEEVSTELKDQEGEIDPIRQQHLVMNLDKAKKRMPDAILQAYCIVVTISEKNEIQAFKVTPTEEPLFNTIKADRRSRIQDTAVTADALLPEGPFDLWKEGDKARRVKDLVGAFAQLPHLPKMLNTAAILDTLVDGCVQGSFVLRLTRPDQSFRTWWHSRPDTVALNDPALEVVLPEAAELSDIAPSLLTPQTLPELWDNKTVIKVGNVHGYFAGGKIVKVPREGFEEPVAIPKATAETVDAAIAAAVEDGQIWLVASPASILGEEIPPGILTEKAELRPAPAPIPPADILPANLPDTWEEGKTTALSIASALSQQKEEKLPWKIVRDAIDAGLRAQFLELDIDSSEWPCEISNAGAVKLRIPKHPDHGGSGEESRETKTLIAKASLEEACQLQDLGEAAPALFDIKAKAGIPLRVNIHIELGDGETEPPPETVEKLNEVLKDVSDQLTFGEDLNY